MDILANLNISYILWKIYITSEDTWQKRSRKNQQAKFEIISYSEEKTTSEEE